MNYAKIKNEVQSFADEREWDKFHSPKNISMALAVESSELLEIFQWLKEDENVKDNADIKNRVEEEISDIFYYIVRMCQKMNINLENAFYEKMNKNRLKYPVDKYKGKSTWNA